MTSFNSLFAEQIRKVARRELRQQNATLRSMEARYRREFAELRRANQHLLRRLQVAEKNASQVSHGALTLKEPEEQMRFRADGLRSHRQRLGLSALHFGKLIGVSGLTIYNWESGKSKPRRSQLLKIASVRGLGKREALKRLEST